jgi:hypothetical protein
MMVGIVLTRTRPWTKPHTHTLAHWEREKASDTVVFFAERSDTNVIW